MQRLHLGPLFILLFAAATATTSAQHQAIPGATANASALFGLPRFDHCALAFNDTLYIFGGRINNSTVALQFSSASIESQPPRFSHMHADTSLWSNIVDGGGCAVTSYGQVIMLPPQKPCGILDLGTLQSVRTNFGGSAAALASFSGGNATASPPVPRQRMATAMWNDMLLVFGGFVSSAPDRWDLSQATFMLDARIRSQWMWYELPVVLGNTPPAGPGAAMVSTQRWILLFSVAHAQTHHNVSVYCFDPYVLMWMGKVVEFVSQTDSLRAAPMVAANGTDSVLVIPAYVSNNSSSSSSTNVPLAARIALLQPHGLWRLDMATDQAAGTIHWISPSQVGPFRPLTGASATKLSNDLIVLYGGDPFSHDSFRFWNVSASSFLDPQWWSATQWHTDHPAHTPTPPPPASGVRVSNRELAIILGTVLGFVVLVMAILVCYCCWYRRRRRQHDHDARQVDASRPPTPQQGLCRPPQRRLTIAPDQLAAAWAAQLRRALSNIGRRSSPSRQQQQQQQPHRAPSPVRPSGPDPPPPPPPASEAPAASEDNDPADTKRQRQIREASRFNEHFDLMAPPDANMLGRVSEEDEEGDGAGSSSRGTASNRRQGLPEAASA